MAWECFLQERHGIISEPSGGSGNETGEEDLSSGHVALSHCLYMSTINLFPDRSELANSLGSGKNGASRNERICRGCRIPPAGKLRHFLKLPITRAKLPDSGRVEGGCP